LKSGNELETTSGVDFVCRLDSESDRDVEKQH
jgi:hypothetical protein